MSFTFVPTPRLGALALSLAAHLSILFWADMLRVADRPSPANKSELVKQISIKVVEQGPRSPTTTETVGAVSEPAGPAPVSQQAGSSALPENPAPAEPYYFKPNQLADRPRALSEPILALEADPAAATILRLLINERGEVDRVMIEQSGLPEAGQALLVDAFSKMKFEPGKIDGVPVKSELTIEVSLDDAPNDGSDANGQPQ